MINFPRGRNITSSIVEEGEPIVTNDILLDGVITLAAEWRCTMTVTDIDGGTNEGSYSFDICPLGQYEECAARLVVRLKMLVMIYNISIQQSIIKS